MTHHLIFDTCVWRELATNESSLTPKIQCLVDAGSVKFILPDLVETEWQSLKRGIKKQIVDEVKKARRAAIQMESFADTPEYRDACDLIKSQDPAILGEAVAAQRIGAVDAMLNAASTIRITASQQARNRAVEHAIEKKAPFGTQNGMVDALIFFSIVDWLDSEQPENPVFVTLNTTDFSVGKADAATKSTLSSDLRPYVETTGLTYEVNIGRALNLIESSIATDQEVERGEAFVELVRLRNAALEHQRLIDKMLLQDPMRDAIERQSKIEELMSRDPMREAMEQQSKIQEMLSRDPMRKAMEQQRKFEEMMSRDPMREAMEQQRKFGEMMSQDPMREAMEQQSKIQEMLSGDPIRDAMDRQSKMEEMMSGDPMREAMEQQTEIQEQDDKGIDSDDDDDQDIGDDERQDSPDGRSDA